MQKAAFHSSEVMKLPKDGSCTRLGEGESRG